MLSTCHVCREQADCCRGICRECLKKALADCKGKAFGSSLAVTRAELTQAMYSYRQEVAR